ncbi:MAG: M48 family metallopeptidase [Ruminococcaceae bacterium]|nr:M48 family metallopeptidase [Oscillospiraceae bacterium]
MKKQPLNTPLPHTLATPAGTIHYQLTRKKVRNLNVRLRPDGSVAVSAPPRMPLGEIEAFLAKKSGWVLSARQRMLATAPAAPCRYTKAECLALFAPVCDAIFPLFADLLGGQKPTLKVRDMTSRWGSCNLKTRTITLNMRLAEKPRAALEYVVLHEYVHFLHTGHQAPFHAEMARLMPDYRQRRKLLREPGPDSK